jgi:hypothetical protein
VFGMGTGVTLLVRSPENRLQALFTLANARVHRNSRRHPAGQVPALRDRPVRLWLIHAAYPPLFAASICQGSQHVAGSSA